MIRTTTKALAVLTIAAGVVLAPTQAEARPIDPSPTHTARTWHPTYRSSTCTKPARWYVLRHKPMTACR